MKWTKAHMKKDKMSDAVKMMRDIRDCLSRELQGMSAAEQIAYVEAKSQKREVESETRYRTGSWTRAEQEATEAYRQGNLEAYKSLDEMTHDILS
jgi:hypothetical protein